MKQISKIAILLFLLLAIVFAPAVIIAQDFQRKIEWQSTPKSISTMEQTTIIQPTFTNATHADQFGLLPFYTEIIPLQVSGEVTVEILNPVFSAAVQIDKASLGYIKNEIEPKGEISFLKKRAGAVVSFIPLRKNATTGIVEKLESFTLRLIVVPKPQKRATHSYASNSGLANGTWYKIAVTANGIYKIDYDFVKNTLKVDPGSFNLSTLGVFGNGGGMVPDLNSEARADDLIENPSWLVDNNGNNKMDENDYLLFYGEMPDEWKFRTSDNSFYHVKNLYSDKNYYFLSTDAGTGKRVTTAQPGGTPNKTITDFDEHFFHENDEENILKSGKSWLGDKMTSFSNSKSFPHNFPNIVNSFPVKFVSRIGAKASSSSSTLLQVNNQTVITHNCSGIIPGDYPDACVPSLMTGDYNATADELNVTYSFSITNDVSGTAAAYIDYFEILFKRQLSMSGNVMNFRNVSSVGSGNISEFRLNNSSSSIKVWEVTDIGNVKEMPSILSGSQLSFVTNTDELKEFVAINMNSSFGLPEFISKIGNQNLHAIGQPDMVIVTHDDFESASNELAAFHRTEDGLSVNVVKVSHIYNEFGCGKPDISAIRDFMRMLYIRAGNDTAQMPRYLLLMGDGSYDPQNREPEKTNFISTYQSPESIRQFTTYTSDDFFGLLDDNEGGDISNISQRLDIAVGRIPVETETEAWEVVNKIKNYKKPQPDGSCVQINTNGSWRNTVTFIADDEDSNIHFDSSDNLAEFTRNLHPVYNYEKIYMDAFKQLPTPAGDRYPDVNTAILNRINAGSLIVNWVGHGGETNWAHERIFNMSEIIPLQNREKLPLFITATCDFSRFDAPERTAGEWLIVNGKGGGIGSITTVRLVFSSANAALNNKVFDYIFASYENRNPTLGEITMLTKNSLGGVDISNTRKFVLLGDPALTLNYPKYNIVTTEVNNKPIAQTDTLKALAQVTIKGEVRDDNGNKMTSFNGVVYPLVFDKISSIQTLGNDPESPKRNFLLYKNFLFKGKASVANGDFSFTFIVPKDINYQVGNGRISYFADNGNYVDAHGYSESILIGGSADSFLADGNGPVMDIYMNDEKFVYGGTTNSDPMLLLKLSDETGINTVGNGIGHDLTAILDDNTQNRVVLNDYYESELDNFKKGEVKYPYSELAEGRHTLKVKAWDIHNNSSEDYTEFVVASDARLALKHVYNYPNPFTTRTQFMFEHNRCCDDLSISIQIYTVSGRLVKSIVEQVRSTGYRVNDIVWDGLDDYGDPIGKGVYVYKIAVRDSEGQAAHKFEKLVVLR